MPYHNLYCSNEKTYRWHAVTDIKEADDSRLLSVINHVKKDINNILKGIGGFTQEKIALEMEKYIPQAIGIQIIVCPSCKSQQIDVIVNDQTKIRKDLWRSYESNRFVEKVMREK